MLIFIFNILMEAYWSINFQSFSIGLCINKNALSRPYLLLTDPTSNQSEDTILYFDRISDELNDRHAFCLVNILILLRDELI